MPAEPDSVTNPLYLYLALAARMKDGETKLEGKSFEDWVMEAFDRFRMDAALGYKLVQNKGAKPGRFRSDAVSAGLGGMFPDLLLSENSQETVFIECKAEEGLQDLQFNSTPPCGTNNKRGEFFRTFYVIGLKSEGRVKRICMVDGYYFNSDVELIDKVWEFVADSLEEKFRKIKTPWDLERKGKGGRDIEPYITHIGSYSEDTGIRARIRRMYHVTNPLVTYASYSAFAVLPKEYLPAELTEGKRTIFFVGGVTLETGIRSQFTRHEIIGGKRTYDLLLVDVY